MAIVYSPDNQKPDTMITCVVCREQKPLRTMSAGLVDAQHNQAFACESHYSEFRRLVIGWVDFAIEQHNALRQNDIEHLFDGGN